MVQYTIIFLYLGQTAEVLTAEYHVLIAYWKGKDRSMLIITNGLPATMTYALNNQIFH